MDHRTLLKAAGSAVALLGAGKFDAEATERVWSSLAEPAAPPQPAKWGRATFVLGDAEVVGWLRSLPEVAAYPVMPVVSRVGTPPREWYDSIHFVDLDPVLGPPDEGYRYDHGVSWDVALRGDGRAPFEVVRRDVRDTLRLLDFMYARWVRDGITSPYRTGDAPMPALRA